MKNKLICLFLAIVMVIGMVGVLASCGGGGDDDTPSNGGQDQGKNDGGNGGNTTPVTPVHEHIDVNPRDGKCDECGALVEHTCIDENGDYKCDICGLLIEHEHVDADGDYHCDIDICPYIFDHTHVDENGDYKCDICNKIMAHEHVDEDGNGLCDICGQSTAHNPVDADGDGLCDVCGKSVSRHGKEEVQEDEWWNTITYPNTNLIFQLTKNTNGQELPSGCERFMAGEDETATGDIDAQVASRNGNAAFYTNTRIEYRYYDDTTEYGWSKNIDTMLQATNTKDDSTPDMFCNFMTDMLCASLKGAFANLYSRSRGTRYIDIDAKGEIDFDDDYFESGYMDDLMASLTLSLDKIYVVASDYFIDLIRAFFIVPVNRYLFDSIAGATIADLNGDGKKDINDLFVEVRNGDWTYDRVITYADKIYRDDNTNSTQDLGDRLGFAVDGTSGLSAAGLLYTTSVRIIEKEWNQSLNNGFGDYEYAYPEENEGLYALSDALTNLFSQTGIIAVKAKENSMYGTSALNQIRNRFASDKILFGGVCLLGSLSYDEYQDMKGTGKGFGIVPVPLYHQYKTSLTAEDAYAGCTLQNGIVVDAEGTPVKDEYLTQIHVVGRAGAIAQCTEKFTQCTAFLQYQSTHSSQILDDFYEYELMYSISDTSIAGNMDILRYIRSNVRTSFDKLFEDAVGFFYSSISETSVQARWHAILLGNEAYGSADTPFRRTNMREIYQSLRDQKQIYLTQLVGEYDRTPD